MTTGGGKKKYGRERERDLRAFVKLLHPFSCLNIDRGLFVQTTDKRTAGQLRSAKSDQSLNISRESKNKLGRNLSFAFFVENV